MGGGEISNRMLLSELVKRGHDVTVIALNTSNSENSKSTEFKLIKPASWLRFDFIRIVFSYAILFFYGIRWAIINNPDILITSTKASAVGVSIAKKLNVPVGIIVRSAEDVFFKKTIKKFKFSIDGVRSTILRLLFGDYGFSALTKSDFIISNSNFIKDKILRSLSDKPVYVVYPPLEFKEIAPFKKTDVKKIYMVGTSEEKGLSFISGLADHFKDVEFFVLGTPGVSLGDEKKVGNITYKGWSNVFKEFSENADLIIVPSICEEAFGRVAIEGLAAGKIVLASNIGGLPEALFYQERLLIEPNNLLSWIKRIEEVLRSVDIFLYSSRLAQEQVKFLSLTNQIDSFENALFSEIKNQNISS